MSTANSQHSNAQNPGSQATHRAASAQSQPAKTKPAAAVSGIDAAAQARAELHKTLDQLSYNLDIPARIDDRVTDVKRKVIRQKRRNPVGFVVGVAAVGLATGAIVAGIALAIARRS